MSGVCLSVSNFNAETTERIFVKSLPPADREEPSKFLKLFVPGSGSLNFWKDLVSVAANWNITVYQWSVSVSSSCWMLSDNCSESLLHYTSHHSVNTTGPALPENNEASAELTTANGGTFTSCSAILSSQSRYSSDWRALTWLAAETGRARSKRSAICSGELISGYMFWYDVNRRYGI